MLIAPTVSSDDNNVDVIVGVVVGLGVLLFVIVIVVIVIIVLLSLQVKRFSRNKEDSTNNTYEDMRMGNVYENVGIQNMSNITEKAHIKH